MRIGVDLDNTIVCYDDVFRRVAAEKAIAHSAESAVKDHLRATLRADGREDEWTALQGVVYGPGMASARLFPGVAEFFARCRERGAQVCIISHRSRYPYLGEQHDLHAAARDWLAASELARAGAMPLVFLELTKEDKLARIASERCTHFIDDLPELLCESAFPANVTKVLFDPHGRHELEADVLKAASWRQITDMLFPGR
jgi:FMN phosphatase YigB (HAD superfamily)